MKHKTLTALLISLTTLGAGSVSAAEWSYDEDWSKAFKTCGEGVNQTPIDINKATTAELPPLDFRYTGTVRDVINNGHTIQANVTDGNLLNVDGDTFELKQFHFHTPSENYIAGKQFPLEAHFVHANKQGSLAVVAVMFETGKNANKNLTTLIEHAPKSGQKTFLSESINLADMLPTGKDYYRFNGSLTTPPCSEGVRWFVFKQPQSSSVEQTAELQSVMGDNARPLQPLNARVVLK